MDVGCDHSVSTARSEYHCTSDQGEHLADPVQRDHTCSLLGRATADACAAVASGASVTHLQCMDSVGMRTTDDAAEDSQSGPPPLQDSRLSLEAPGDGGFAEPNDLCTETPLLTIVAGAAILNDPGVCKSAKPAKIDGSTHQLHSDKPEVPPTGTDLLPSCLPSSSGLANVADAIMTAAESPDLSGCENKCQVPVVTDDEPPAGAHVTDDEDLLTVLDKELSPKKTCSDMTVQQSLLEEANRSLLKQLESVRLERDRLEAVHAATQAELQQQLKKLEKASSDHGSEIKFLKDTLTANEISSRATVLELREQHVTAMEQISRRYNECKEEKEAAIVKYAQTERKAMQQQAALEKLEIKVLEKEREKDLLLEKVKAAKAEKQKLADSFEEKNTEIQQLKKDMEKQKEALSSLDNKAKWAQNRLKSELEAHKETKQKLDEVTRKLNEAKEEAEQIRKNCQEIIKTYQESEEIKSNSLDLELRKKETELKAHLMEKENTSEALTMRQKELESLKAQCKEKSDQLVALESKVHQLETQRTADERILSDLRATLEHQRQESAVLQEKLLQYSALEDSLEREQHSVERLSRQVAELRTANGELQTEMDACRCRQDEMLVLTQKMAERNAALTSENTSLHSRLSTTTQECSALNSTLSELQATNERLVRNDDNMKKSFDSELSSLRSQLEERQRLSETLALELEDERAEIKTLKKKQALSLKELTRELQQLRKKVDGYEGHAADKPNGATHSRSNSCGSSDAVDAAIGKGEWVMVNAKSVPGPATPVLQSPPAELAASQLLPETRFVEPDKQKLIEKVVKLQRALARSGEKIEFLEDHNKQLLEEVQKKSRIIQLYVMREDTGSMSSDFVDKHKEQLAKKGGILHADGRITLELSMEMNHKLQAVLEETLLKNMTLKDNIDTLGKEIARLSVVSKPIRRDTADGAQVT